MKRRVRNLDEGIQRNDLTANLAHALCLRLSRRWLVQRPLARLIAEANVLRLRIIHEVLHVDLVAVAQSILAEVSLRLIRALTTWRAHLHLFSWLNGVVPVRSRINTPVQVRRSRAGHVQEVALAHRLVQVAVSLSSGRLRTLQYIFNHELLTLMADCRHDGPAW